VTPFIRNDRDRFPAACLRGAADLSALRWTIDYPDDLALVRRLAEAVDDPVAADRFDFLRVLERIGGADGPAHRRNEGLVASLTRDATDPPQG
jgi:spore coat polysaccharide biosynthesis protein SpsF